MDPFKTNAIGICFDESLDGSSLDKMVSHIGPGSEFSPILISLL